MGVAGLFLFAKPAPESPKRVWLLIQVRVIQGLKLPGGGTRLMQRALKKRQLVFRECDFCHLNLPTPLFWGNRQSQRVIK